jgi:hypothetical protein
MTTLTQQNKDRNYWGEDPRVPLCEWQYEVRNGDTRLGYWEFVQARMDEDEELGVDTPSSPPLSSDDEQTEIEKENAQASWETPSYGPLSVPPRVERGTIPDIYSISDEKGVAEVAAALRSIARREETIHGFEFSTEIRIPMRLLLRLVHGEGCIG